MSADTPPQARVFRRLFQGIHLVVAVVFGSMLAIGVWNGLAEIRPERPVQPIPVEACVERAAALREELLDRLGSIAHADSAAEEGQAFEKWSVEYRGRLLRARSRCRPPQGASPEQADAIAEAYGAVIRTLDLSAIAATHWARHLGPSLDDATRAIDEARALR